jgi:hypothetical protein
MTKKKVIEEINLPFSVTRMGVDLPPEYYTWDAKKRIFKTEMHELTIDCWEDGITFHTKGGSTFLLKNNCHVSTDYYCNIIAGDNCTLSTIGMCNFTTGNNCKFHTQDACNFITGDDCTFKTGSACFFITGDNCTFDVGEACIFQTKTNCTFKNESHCIYITEENCKFKSKKPGLLIDWNKLTSIQIPEAPAAKKAVVKKK